MDRDLIWLGLIVVAVITLVIRHARRGRLTGTHQSDSEPWAGDWGRSDHGGADGGADSGEGSDS